MKKEMLINVLQPEECRIAIVEDGVLEELYVERTSHESYTGNIYKGKVVNLEPAIQAAFVDFSVGRNGFLHVSDVEPQYYQRNQAEAAEPPRREREDRKRPRGEDREVPPPTGRGEERLRDRERPERPDRSERGRRDRSEPRRFGEGLTDDDVFAPAPPPARPVPPPRVEAPEEPRRGRTETIASLWPQDVPYAGTPEHEGRAAEIDEPRGRINRPIEPFDPDLPPSRTQRPRVQPPAARFSEIDDEEEGRARIGSPPLDVEPEPPAPRERDTRRGRGRGRSRPAPEPEVLAPLPPEPLPDEDVIEPVVDERVEPARRRGGRAAIRSRGGEQEAPPERPRDVLPERPRDVLPERPRDVLPERPRDVLPERPRDVLPERPRGYLPERAVDIPAERARPVEPEPPRERERGRPSEPELPRERSKPHARAGEPGYIPRRERVRGPETPFGAEPPSALGWPEFAEPIAEIEPEDAGGDEDAAAGTRTDGPRRRRRR
ncbi:MAG: hypothetical protein P4L84_09610, partial [Isosphaeraceae bacterium]|nr:hypothetical protein [Isosphaeraceae bacterium]